MIRVLHCVRSMDMGGIETFIMNVYRKIDRDQIQFDFLVSINQEAFYDAEIRTLGGRIYDIPSRRDGILKEKRALCSFFREHKEYKIIHYHVSSLTNIGVLQAAKKHGIPVRIIHGHSTREGGSVIHKYLHMWNQRKINHLATHYFACSKASAKWMYSRRQYNHHKYEIIRNGIDVADFKYDPQKRSVIRKEFGLSEDHIILGHIGRFDASKNHFFLMDVFSEINSCYDNVRLILVGDGELCKKIKIKVLEMGLKNQVIFTGVRADIPALLSAMDIFVIPSIYEGLPVTLIEAQTSGLPCIVSDVVTREVQLLRNIQFVSLKRSVSDWAKVILEAEAKGSDRSDAGKAVVRKGFDINEVAVQLQRFYVEA